MRVEDRSPRSAGSSVSGAQSTPRETSSAWRRVWLSVKRVFSRGDPSYVPLLESARASQQPSPSHNRRPSFVSGCILQDGPYINYGSIGETRTIQKIDDEGKGLEDDPREASISLSRESLGCSFGDEVEIHWRDLDEKKMSTAHIQSDNTSIRHKTEISPRENPFLFDDGNPVLHLPAPASHSSMNRMLSVTRKIRTLLCSAPSLAVASATSLGIAIWNGIAWGAATDVFTEECSPYLNSTLPRNFECKYYEDTYKTLYTHFSLVALSVCVFGGIIFQKFCAMKQEDQSAQRCSMKKTIAKIQKYGSLPIWFFTGWLYRGLSFDQHRADSWNVYYKLQESSIYIGNFLLGIVIRKKYVKASLYIQELKSEALRTYETTKAVFLKHLPFVMVSALLFLTFPSSRVLIELCIAAAARPFAHLFVNLMRKKRVESENGKLKTVLLRLEASLKEGLSLSSFLWFYLYAKYFSSDEARNVMMALLGLITGAKEAFHEEISYDSNEFSFRDPETKKRIPKRYLETGAVVSLIVLGSALQATGWPQCYHANPHNCHLVLGIEGQWINFDGKGGGVALLAGSIHYIVRKTLRRNWSNPFLQKARVYVDLTDRLFLECWLAVPYAMFNQSNYFKEYEAYVSYNPDWASFFLGLVMGTHFDRLMNSEIEETEPDLGNIAESANK